MTFKHSSYEITDELPENKLKDYSEYKTLAVADVDIFSHKQLQVIESKYTLVGSSVAELTCGFKPGYSIYYIKNLKDIIEDNPELLDIFNEPIEITLNKVDKSIVIDNTIKRKLQTIPITEHYFKATISTTDLMILANRDNDLIVPFDTILNFLNKDSITDLDDLALSDLNYEKNIVTLAILRIVFRNIKIKSRFKVLTANLLIPDMIGAEEFILRVYNSIEDPKIREHQKEILSRFMVEHSLFGEFLEYYNEIDALLKDFKTNG